MSLHRFALACAAILAVTACDRDTGGSTGPDLPRAFIRYVNAIPDTGALDFRVIDGIELSPGFFGARFRDASPYQGLGAGSRHLRVFMNDSNPVIASRVIFDTTTSFTAGTYYTVVLTGFSRAGQNPGFRGIILTDDRPTPAATQIAIRVLNASPNNPAIDVYQRQTGAPLPGTLLAGNIAFRARSPYVTLPTSAALRLAVTAAGTTTPVLADVLAPAGQPTAPIIGGSAVGGTAITAIFVSPSVAGSRATQFTTPSIVYIVDRNPGNTP